MTHEERIAELQRANDESRAEIARRETLRFTDPIAYDDDQRAERDENSIGDVTVQKFGAHVLMYRTHENNSQTLAAEAHDRGLYAADPAAESDAPLFGDHRDEMLSRAIGVVISHERHARRQELERALVARDRKIAALEGELREVKGMLGATLQLLGQQKPKLWLP
jgi:hypothetical protein